MGVFEFELNLDVISLMVVISNTRGISDNHSAQKNISSDRNSIYSERISKSVSNIKYFPKKFIMIAVKYVMHKQNEW